MANQAKPIFETPVPDDRNEAPFANILRNLEFPLNDRPHVWMIRIPHMRDVDVVLLFPRSGLFNVELKSWPLHLIEGFDQTVVRVEKNVKHSTRDAPWYQAQKAGESLRTMLYSDSSCLDVLGKPWLTSVAALYRISRESFRDRFLGMVGVSGEDSFRARISEEVLFEEDLRSGSSFLSRLNYCRMHPVFGVPPDYPPRRIADSSMAATAIGGVLRPSLYAKAHVSKIDAERLRKLEDKASRVLDPVDWSSYAFCTGYVGTGKTLLGLQAALGSLEMQGGNGLFVCFNKVLATDISRLLQLSPRFATLGLDVRDVTAVLKRTGDLVGIPVQLTKDVNAAAAAVVPDVIRAYQAQKRESPGVLVVDEAQDIPDWGWSLIEALLGPSTRYFVIESRGQELYRDPDSRAASLSALATMVQDESGKTNYIERRRVYRNKAIPFLLSQLFLEAYPDTAVAEDIWRTKLRPQYEKSLGRRSSTKQLELSGIGFERKGGWCPNLVRLSLELQDPLPVTAKILKDAHEQSKARFRVDQPCGLLILVPHPEGYSGKGSHWNELAREACRKNDLRYIDYTADDNRRQGYAVDEVRISTFHSSKGIEGLHVIILGFDSLGDVAPRFPGGIQSLGYVVLSRSLYETDIVVESRENERSEVAFLEHIIEIVGA